MEPTDMDTEVKVIISAAPQVALSMVMVDAQLLLLTSTNSVLHKR